MLDAIPPARKTGDESFHDGGSPLGFRIVDFWRWAGSDLLNNAQRGILAEYLVAQALGASDGVRVEWDSKDIVTPDGVSVEVKSSAYRQSWAQDDYSDIRFTVGQRKGWDAATDSFATEYARSADVYVFCLLHEKNQELVDPLDVRQWTFYVVARTTLDDQLGEQESMGIKTLQRLCDEPVSFGHLDQAVRLAGRTDPAE